MVVGLCIQSPAYRRNKTAIVHVQLWHLDPVWLEISQHLALPLWTSRGKRQNTDSFVPLLWGLISSCLAEPKHSPFMLHNTPLGEFSRGKKNYTHTHTHTHKTKIKECLHFLTVMTTFLRLLWGQTQVHTEEHLAENLAQSVCLGNVGCYHDIFTISSPLLLQDIEIYYHWGFWKLG